MCKFLAKEGFFLPLSIRLACLCCLLWVSFTILMPPECAKASDFKKGDICHQVGLETLKSHIPFAFPPDAKIVSKRNTKGLCEVILNIRGRDFPFYVGKDFVILGQMFSNKQNLSNEILKSLTQKSRKQEEKLFKKLKGEVDKVAVMEYKPSNKPQRTIYMFTDPLCPFCHRAEGQIIDVAKRHNATLKIVFFPVHLPRGKEKSVEAICRKMDLNTYLKDDWRNEKEPEVQKFQCAAGEQIVERSMALGKKLKIMGVPTFILDNGKRVVGANMNKLDSVLSASTH